MRVLYNEIHLGLHQIICNSNIQECDNYGLIQTNYDLGKDVLGRGLSGNPCTFIATSDFNTGNLW